jgi:hypothetical protein
MATTLTVIWWLYGHHLWKKGLKEGSFYLI